MRGSLSFLTISAPMTRSVVGLKGIIVGEGDTYDEALADVKSAIRFHIETFGQDVFEADPPLLEAFIAEAGVGI